MDFWLIQYFIGKENWTRVRDLGLYLDICRYTYTDTLFRYFTRKLWFLRYADTYGLAYTRVRFKTEIISLANHMAIDSDFRTAIPQYDSLGIWSIYCITLRELLWTHRLDLHVGGFKYSHRDSKVHGANMGPTWVLSAPDGPHVVPMNHLAIRTGTGPWWMMHSRIWCIFPPRTLELLFPQNEDAIWWFSDIPGNGRPINMLDVPVLYELVCWN